VYNIKIVENNTVPYYCEHRAPGPRRPSTNHSPGAQARHCQAGMVGVINPRGNNTLANLRAAAAAATSSPSPTAPVPESSSPAPQGDGFSQGAKYGVGISVGVIGALLLVIAGVWFYLRRRNRRRPAAVSRTPSAYRKPELESHPPPRMKSVHELDGTGRRAELGGAGRSELPVMPAEMEQPR